MAKPSIVLVPGSFSSSALYQPLIDRLRAKGYPSLAIVLPSTQKRLGLEPATMDEDAARIRAVAEALISQGKEVVVMCHSYGGVPTTQALAGLAVKRIIYLAAIVPRIGESQSLAMATPFIEVLIKSAQGGYMHIDPVLQAGAIGNDFANWEYAFECAQHLAFHSAISFRGAVTQVAYAAVPVSYVFTEKDLIVSPEFQEGYIAKIEEAQGRKIDVVRKPWGHCPNWSFPEELIELVIAEAEK